MNWADDLGTVIEDVAFSVDRTHGVGGLFIARAIRLGHIEAGWGEAMPVSAMGKMVAGSMAER